MITFTGISVMMDNEEAPNLTDIAVSLGRLPRFCGHTLQWWPVLAHSLAVYDILNEVGARTETLLYGLLHDAHESVFGDIPRTWKTPLYKDLGKSLDSRIFTKLGLRGFPAFDAEERVHRADELALVHEVYTVGNVEIRKYFASEHLLLERPLSIIAKRAYQVRNAKETVMALRSPMVHEFIQTADTLIKALIRDGSAFPGPNTLR